MNSYEVQRFQHYLENHREEALISLDRLGDETRSLDFDYPQDVADRCVTSLSKESLFQRKNERPLFSHMIQRDVGDVT
jgi:hypothetical protein